MTPLVDIAARLFGADEHATEERPAVSPAPTDDTDDKTPLSPRLRAALAARQHHEQALRGETRRAGVVVRIRHDGYGPLEDDTPINILLDREDSNGLWHGWLVTPDSEYAADQDLLVQATGEEIPDVAVRLVQCWNSVHVTREMLGRPIQDLGITVVEQARILAVTQISPERPQPGVLARRLDLPEGPVTGTPLASEDPRRDYQHLYRTAACYVCAAADAKQGNAARTELLLAGIARQLKNFRRTVGAAWPLRPQMHDPVPATLNYQLADAFNLRIEPLPNGQALFSVAALASGANASVTQDKHPPARDEMCSTVRIPLEFGHDYHIHFSRSITDDQTLLRLTL